MPLCIRSILKDCALRLEQGGADAPRLCAELLLAHVLDLERGELIKTLLLDPEKKVEAEDLERLQALVARRERGEPVAYLLGRKEFYGRDFLVNPAVLVPRPETELLIDLALARAPALAGLAAQNQDRRPDGELTLQPGGEPTLYAGGKLLWQSEPPLFADLGAGSGCIGITLALELPAWRGLCLEKSPAAAKMAQANIRLLQAQKRLYLLRADYRAAPLPEACLSLAIANPPYVGEDEYALLAPEVRLEPKSALVPDAPGRADGSEGPLSVLREAARLLRPGGLLLMEIGCSQGPAMLAALEEKTWTRAAIVPDLAGLDRVLSAIRR